MNIKQNDNETMKKKNDYESLKKCPNDIKTRLCKNKKCRKPLPEGYKYTYCEACRNQQAQKAKKVGKGVGLVVGTVASVAIAIVTGGMINPKE